MSSLTRPIAAEQPDTLAGSGRPGSRVPHQSRNKPGSPVAPAAEENHRVLCPRCGYGHLHRPISIFSIDTCIGLVRSNCSRCMYEEKHFRLTGVVVAECVILLLTSVAAVWFSLHPVSLSDVAGKPDDRAAAVLAGGRMATNGDKLTSFEQMMLHKPRGTLDNATVLRLWRANIDPDLVLLMVKTSTPDYDLSAGAIIELKQANVDPLVIRAMINATYGTPTTP